MALITDLPSNASPAYSDFMITDNGTTTNKSTIRQIKESGLGIANNFGVAVGQILANSSVTLNLSSARGLLYATGADNATHGVWIFNTSSSGYVLVTPILSTQKLNVSTGTNTLTLTSTATSQVFYEVFLVTGSVTV